jgi:DNA topoisomerase IB
LLDRERVLACAVRLLDRGLFRVGSDTYAEQNGSFGLATIHREHVRVGRGELTFDYPAKSGVRRVHAVRDPLVTEAVCELKRRRSGSQRLLAYRAGRRWHEIHSDDVNGYLREHAGCHCSAKDFRTWNATVLAALELARLGPAPRGSQAALRRAVSHTAAAVASQLGNTPAVCRSSYIDPRVFDRYRAGVTVDAGRIEPGELLGHDRARHVLERAVLALLD